MDSIYDPERAFAHLYGESPDAFWLDSSMLDERTRFSFMGDAEGPLASSIDYDAHSGELRVTAGGETTVLQESIFDYLAREMRRLRYLSDDLPFDFNCGFAGYFGYELKADSGGSKAHRSSLPDAHFVFADRMIAFDHVEQCTYVLGVAERGDTEEVDRWIAETSLRLAALPPIAEPEWSEVATERDPVEFRLSRSHQQYLDDIEACKRYLVDGETYEICLTNKITAEVSARPATALPDPAPNQSGPVLRLPADGRGGRDQLLPGALPLDRPRPLGGGEADQGDDQAGQATRRRTCGSPRSCGRGRKTGRRT